MATVLVALATMAVICGWPTSMSVGKLSSVPPPATALIAPARTDAKNKISRSSQDIRYSLFHPILFSFGQHCCLKAAAPNSPPIPIDSTAVLGTSINAPFSLSPS